MSGNDPQHGSGDLPHGVYDVDYYHGRHKKKQLVYRLRRRTDEVERALRTYTEGPLKVIVDVGTADALMLRNLQQRLGSLTYLGIDRSFHLLNAEKLDGILKTQADALHLPVKDGVADALVATAIIEHVPDPPKMMREMGRALRKGGLMVITTPAPFMEKVAEALGIWKEGGHDTTLNLKQLKQMAQDSGFTILEAGKFMFSPIGFPAEKAIEKIFGPLGLRLVMANQLLVARKKE
ncbi:MAG TPA: class I SAM-dependent methyltransferase [Acidobacteriota bacterium]|nr:class I SAM-dependent methyltransferase [Acidobacteriota bacterium]